jgi:hypothetical protein
VKTGRMNETTHMDETTQIRWIETLHESCPRWVPWGGPRRPRTRNTGCGLPVVASSSGLRKRAIAPATLMLSLRPSNIDKTTRQS